jgi:short-subunit dehydrogenase
MNTDKFRKKYGPWALVAGASMGIGKAFAFEIAKKGLNVILVARSKDLLDDLATEIESKYSVKAIALQLDLSDKELLQNIANATKDYEIGLLVYNAAFSKIGSYFDLPIEQHMQITNVNCRGPVILSYHFGNLMKKRGHGGVILMSSLTAFQGSPVVAHYGATKAFNLNLAEALWDELKPYNVDVKAIAASATATPGYLNQTPPNEEIKGLKPKVMTPEAVAEEALRKLHRNRPFIIPGAFNKVIGFLMSRIMSRKMAIKTIGSVNRKMYGEV